MPLFRVATQFISESDFWSALFCDRNFWKGILLLYINKWTLYVIAKTFWFKNFSTVSIYERISVSSTDLFNSNFLQENNHNVLDIFLYLQMYLFTNSFMYIYPIYLRLQSSSLHFETFTILLMFYHIFLSP